MKKISDFNNATEKYPVIYAGSATRPEFVDMPTTLQQQEGVAPMDTLPAQWWNAMWKLATRDINAFRDYVGDSITEINNLLTKFGITLDDADSEQLYDFFHDDYVQNYLGSIFVHKNGDTIDGDLHIKGDLSVDGIGEEIISTELKVGANTITLRNDNPTALGNTELAGVVTENYDGNNHNNIISVDKNGVARTGDIDIATRILYSNDGINFYTDEDLTIPATIGATEEVRDTGNQTSGGVEIYEGITYSNDDTQPLLTRAESNAIANGHYLKWDAVNKRAVDGGGAIDMFFPIGSLYWTAKAPDDGGDPNVLFGGTWVQIKDKFILSAGDTYANGSTGGSATVTLTSTQIPSHNHSGTTDVNNRGHVHEFTPTGIIGSSPGATDFQTGGMSAHKTGWVEIRPANYDTLIQSDGSTFVQSFTSENRDVMFTTGTQQKSQNLTVNIEHAHGAYFTGNTNDTKGESQNHTHSYTTTSAYGNPADSGNASAHNNMPPYVVKYCWERTA